MPNSVPALNTLTAISPLFAAMTFFNFDPFDKIFPKASEFGFSASRDSTSERTVTVFFPVLLSLLRSPFKALPRTSFLKTVATEELLARLEGNVIIDRRARAAG